MMQNSKNLNHSEICTDITYISNQWHEIQLDMESLFQRSVDQILKKIELPRCFHSKLELSVVLCDDPYIQDLNKQYMGKNKPTNVLSFPLMNGTEHNNELIALGDIVLSYETINNEALDQHKSLEDHITHLFIHGFLHLLGYDHVEENDAQEMEHLEINILEDLGIKNPYQ